MVPVLQAAIAPAKLVTLLPLAANPFAMALPPPILKFAAVMAHVPRQILVPVMLAGLVPLATLHNAMARVVLIQQFAAKEACVLRQILVHVPAVTFTTAPFPCATLSMPQHPWFAPVEAPVLSQTNAPVLLVPLVYNVNLSLASTEPAHHHPFARAMENVLVSIVVNANQGTMVPCATFPFVTILQQPMHVFVDPKVLVLLQALAIALPPMLLAIGLEIIAQCAHPITRAPIVPNVVVITILLAMEMAFAMPASIVFARKLLRLVFGLHHSVTLVLPIIMAPNVTSFVMPMWIAKEEENVANWALVNALMMIQRATLLDRLAQFAKKIGLAPHVKIQLPAISPLELAVIASLPHTWLPTLPKPQLLARSL